MPSSAFKRIKTPTQTFKKLVSPKNSRDVLLGETSKCPSKKYCEIDFGNITCKALVDTGADLSLLDSRVYEKIDKERKSNLVEERFIKLKSVTGQNIQILGKSLVHFKIQDKEFSFIFSVVENLRKDVIIGDDFLINCKGKWDFERATLKLNGLHLSLLSKNSVTFSVPSIEQEIYASKLEHLSQENFSKFKDTITRNIDLFSKSETDLGKTNLVKMTLDTGDSAPIKQKPYKTPFSLRPEVEKHIDDLLTANLIRPSTSPWASPIIVVPKKDGGSRICIDYRKLNSVTVSNSYPIPSISDILASLKNAKYFSCLDLKSGYHQIEMEERDKEKTAFVCFKGLFEYNVMPFGLCSAPPVFQELMNRVLGDAINNYAFAYIDDIIIYSPDIDSHLNHLQSIFNKLKQANLKLKLSKCSFGVSKVDYLGHEISAEGVRPDPQKVEAIQNIRPPNTVKQVRSFLGLVGFYRQFIKNFAEVANPLTQLTKKFCRFSWSSECQKSFETLKRELCKNVVLAHPDQNKPYKLYTDASQFAVGAVLTQEVGNEERVIQFLSKQLNKSQIKWPTIEKEAYAIVYATNKLRHYLYGSQFTVITDHKPLRSLFTAEMKNARIQRWAIMLSEFGCNVEYLAGKDNIPADALSRVNGNDISVIDTSGIVNLDAPESTPLEGDLDDCDEECPHETSTEVESSIDLNNFDMSREQRKDTEIEGLITLLLDGATIPEYVLENDMLYHITPKVKGENAPSLQLMVPSHLTRDVMDQLHCSPFGGGHMSANRTYENIRRRYFWSGMYRDVHQYVTKCDVCNQRKTRLNKVPIQSMPVANYPFQIIGIDTSGPYHESNSGNKYILTIIDHLSGWPEAFPLRNKSALSVAEVILNEIIPRHSCPQIMISDRGTEFVNAVIGYIIEKMRIAHIKTSPYHPQSNGKTERFHRYMNDSLAKYSHKEPNDWDKYIPAMLMAYRTITNETTEKSPFLIIHGRDPVLPIDTLLQPQLRYMGDDYVPTMLQRVHNVYIDAKQNIRSSQDRNQELANKRAKLETFEAGDAVYYLDLSYSQNAPHCKKLQSKWKPFYRIVKRTSPVNYQIRHQMSGVTKNVHVKDLKRTDPSSCWDKQYETYTDLTAHVVNPDEPVRRQMPPRLAKLTAPLSNTQPPTSNLANKTVPPLKLYNTAEGWKASDTSRKRKLDPDLEDDSDVPPVRLRKTSHGWALNTDDHNEMDVTCIYLYDVNSDIVF